MSKQGYNPTIFYKKPALHMRHAIVINDCFGVTTIRRDATG
jgi:hypothetical protein